jgi:hypothetical protein
VASSTVLGRLASRLMRTLPRNNLNFADRRAFLAGVPLRSGDALPGVAEVGDDLELGAESTDVVSQGGELGTSRPHRTHIGSSVSGRHGLVLSFRLRVAGLSRPLALRYPG